MTRRDHTSQRVAHLDAVGRRSKWLAFPLTALLVVALADQTHAVAAPTGWQPPTPRDVAGVAVRNVTPPDTPMLPQPASSAGPQKVTWPAPGRAEVDLSGTTVPRSAAAAARDGARAGTLPVRLTQAPADAVINGKRVDPAATPTRVSVAVHDRAAADKAGIRGVLLSVARTDTSLRTGAVSLSLDYSGFADAYGGDWATRLRLVQLPACAVTRPTDKTCTTGTPLATVNDAAGQTLTATAPLAAAGTVLAAAAGPSGDNGDYGATDLSSAGTWNVSHQTGDFTWSLPVRVPDASGGLSPSVSLGYSSGSVDGLTGGTNTQGGWAGDGWSLWPGFIERRYAGCADDNPGHKTGDQCWFNQNATLSLNGHAGELIQDGSVWRLKSDDGTTAERLTSAERANGDDNDEYWKVTTSDGVRYYFGYHRLPGWSSDKAVTNSVWTLPVYGNDSTDPCYDADFDKAYCAQAWRWNLDYVVDPHGNSLAYFYGKESGAYGRNMDVDKRTTYDRGGYLKRVEYGTRTGAEYDQPAPLRVVFDTAERCKSGCWSGTAWNSAAVKSAWPDTPWDQYCDEGTRCTENVSPTFWSSRRLTKITTQKRNGASTYADIESWALRHDFINAGTGETTPMWLSGVTHAGLLQNIAGDPSVQNPVTAPEILFRTGAEPLDNRVDSDSDSRTALARWRIKQIRTESGGDLLVTYSAPGCTRASLPQPDTNTTRCMPAYYSWPGTGAPTIDWFHKYVVTRVDQDDLVTDQPTTTTFYDYLDNPAWHYQDDEITKDKFKTWGEWRGYGKVRVRQGTDAGQQSVVEYQYLRGMDGDHLKDGTTRSASLTDWGGTVVDHEALNGFLRQEINYNGVTGTGVGAELNSTVNTPWKRGPTATRTRNGVTTNAYITHTGKTRIRTVLAAAGGYRYRTISSTFNDDGLATTVDDTGDEGVAADESCIRNTYARNATTWILDKITMTEKLSVACAAAPPTGTQATVVSRTRNFYDTYTDETSFGTPPVKGDLVRVEELDSWVTGTPRYVRTQSTGYDPVGRVTSSTDARGYTTTTEYTTSNGGLVTQTVATDPLLHQLITSTEPAWNAPVTIADSNNIATTLRYDALGRLRTVWLPGHSSTAAADMKYDYGLRQSGGPSSVTTENLLPSGTYARSTALYDGFLRERQRQTQATGGGRLLTDTFYNTRGVVDWTSQAYYDVANTPVGTDIGRPQGQIPAIIEHVYDGGGRETAAVFKALGQEKWRTTTTYGGDRTNVTPPDGGTATTTITDVFDRTTTLRQYKNPADVGKDDVTLFDAVSYTYDAAGNLKTHTDAAKNVWSYTYDLRGRQISAKDPDRGTTTTTYDAAGNVETVTSPLTDTTKQTLAYTYDKLGRRATTRDGSTTGAKRAEWVYDTLTNGIGRLTKSIRWIGTTAYENRVDAYDTSGHPTSTSVVLPSSAGALCASESTAPCTYSTPVTYRSNGALATTTMPQAAGLAKEKLTLGYDDVGVTTTLLSPLQIYVQTATYDKLGMLTGRTLGNTGSRVAVTSTFDEPTRRLTSTNVVPELKNEAVNFGYEYSKSGNITKIADTAQGQTADIQCFAYDYLARLSTARTSAANDCTTAPSLSTLGTSAPYWHAWQYDTTGNRTKETRYAAAGNSVTNSTYPAPGPTSVRPHAVTQTTTTTGGQSVTRGYTYDAVGNTKTRPSDAGVQQTLTWDIESHLNTVTESSTSTSFIYDADGNRLIRTTPTGKTLYLSGGTEVSVATGTSTANATRYYTHAGTTIAMRTLTGLTWIIGDHHGTSELTIAASGLAVTKRRTLPFGQQRTNPSGWPTAMDKGFVGGTKDPTGLTHLGAREYDPALGRFISVDPLLNIGDPGSWNGYAYANNSPVTSSDADGLSCIMDDGSQCGPAKRTSPSSTNTSSNGNSGSGNNGRGNGGRGGDNSGANHGRAEIDYTPEKAYVCVLGYFCMAQREQVTRPAEYINAYNAELARIRARWGFDLADYQYAEAMIGACGMGADSNCTSNTYNDLNNIYSAKAVAAKEARFGVDKVKAAEAAGFAALATVAGLPSCVLKGAGGRKSFSGDTAVLMADGSTRKIADVRVGDKVMATDPETGEQGARTVSALWVHDDDFYTLKINGGLLTTTEDHPFWNATDRRWERADQLDHGDRLLTADGSHAYVDGFVATAEHSFIATVKHTGNAYNLTVDDLHTYYVIVGSTPVLVHNEGGTCPVTGGPHGAMGQDASLARLQAGGYTDIVPEPQFRAADGRTFRADFIARDPDGVIHVIDSKVNTGGVTLNQRKGYPDMSAGNATVYTSRLESGYGLRNGDTMPAANVEFDHWICPACE